MTITNPSVPLKRYLTTAEAADYIGASPEFLEIGRCKGRGPRFIRAGHGQRGMVRYDREELDKYMAERTVDYGERMPRLLQRRQA